MKRFQSLAIAGLAAGALALVPSLSYAISIQGGQNVTVAKGTTHQGSLYAAGQTITIDGDVNGDVLCGGETITINGAVHGDVLCAGQTITINGPVDGSVRTLSQMLTINSSVGRNVTSAGESLGVGRSGKVAGELSMLGQSLALDGPVGRDVAVAGQRLELDSTVGGNIQARVQQLVLDGTAMVTGNLDYTNEQALNLDAAKVHGVITHHEPPAKHEPSPRDLFLAWLGHYVYWAVAGLVVTLVLVWLLPRPVRRVTNVMISRAGGSLGRGVITLLVTPALAIMLGITVIGAPLGVLLAVLYVIGIVTSLIMAAVATGQWLMTQTGWHEGNGTLAWAATIGVPGLLLIEQLPFVGFIVTLLVLWWGLGGLILAIQDSKQH